MVNLEFKAKAKAILTKLKIPKNEAERYKRDWARAIVDGNQSMAVKTWEEYCRYIHQCGIAER